MILIILNYILNSVWNCKYVHKHKTIYNKYILKLYLANVFITNSWIDMCTVSVAICVNYYSVCTVL